MKKTKQLALTALLCALGTVLMLSSGLLPLMTFAAPALAGLALIPVFTEYGSKAAYAAYAVIACLSLILCPDKEAALLFLSIGFYPVLRWRLDQIRNPFLRILAKLGVFNLAVGGMYAVCIFLFRLDALYADYLEAGLVISLVTLLLGNLVLLLYDRLLAGLTILYVRKLRDKLMKP